MNRVRICKRCNHTVERYLNDYFCKCAIVDWIDSIRYGFPVYWEISLTTQKPEEN